MVFDSSFKIADLILSKLNVLLVNIIEFFIGDFHIVLISPNGYITGARDASALRWPLRANSAAVRVPFIYWFGEADN